MSRTRILVVAPTERHAKWTAALAEALDRDGVDAEVIDHSATPDYDPAGIEYAVVWHPPEGVLAGLPDLKAVCNLGAGVDAILHDPAFPDHVPIVRLIDPAMTRDMSQWVTYWVLHHARGFERFRTAQAAATWTPKGYGDPAKTTVGFLGFGEMAKRCARDLLPYGYRVCAWARTPKSDDAVETFAGPEGLDALLPQTDILVCLLPLTPDTEGLLNAATLARLPQGAAVINAGRGRELVLNDLLAAMQNGHIAGATLDVTDPEPLPDGHAAWSQPNLHITPHVSALTYPRTAAGVVVGSIRTLMAGGTPDGVVDRVRAY
jgi:glyoxylate/hydroxypyruvate reductase A